MSKHRKEDVGPRSDERKDSQQESTVVLVEPPATSSEPGHEKSNEKDAESPEVEKTVPLHPSPASLIEGSDHTQALPSGATAEASHASSSSSSRLRPIESSAQALGQPPSSKTLSIASIIEHDRPLSRAVMPMATPGGANSKAEPVVSMYQQRQAGDIDQRTKTAIAPRPHHETNKDSNSSISKSTSSPTRPLDVSIQDVSSEQNKRETPAMVNPQVVTSYPHSIHVSSSAAGALHSSASSNPRHDEQASGHPSHSNQSHTTQTVGPNTNSSPLRVVMPMTSPVRTDTSTSVDARRQPGPTTIGVNAARTSALQAEAGNVTHVPYQPAQNPGATTTVYAQAIPNQPMVFMVPPHQYPPQQVGFPSHQSSSEGTLGASYQHSNRSMPQYILVQQTPSNLSSNVLFQQPILGSTQNLPGIVQVPPPRAPGLMHPPLNPAFVQQHMEFHQPYGFSAMPQASVQGEDAGAEAISKRKRKRRDDTPVSQFRGVSWDHTMAKWRTKINSTHVGYYENETEAAMAYDRKAIELRGSKAPRTLNFPGYNYAENDTKKLTRDD